MLQEYYDIVIYNNEIAVVEKIYDDKYKYFNSIFNYVYHTKNGKTFPLHKNFDAGIDMLIVDDKHLYELLDDLREQEFCDSVEFTWIDEYGYDAYKAF